MTINGQKKEPKPTISSWQIKEKLSKTKRADSSRNWPKKRNTMNIKLQGEIKEKQLKS
jgi:hypothetical protein